MADWTQLPLIVLQQIFDQLTDTERIQFSSTCRRWRVLFHPCLSRRVTFSLTAVDNDKAAAQRAIIEHCGSISNFVTIEFNPQLLSSMADCRQLLAMMSDNQNLHEVELRPLFPQVSDDGKETILSCLEAIVRTTSRLEVLSLGGLASGQCELERLLQSVVSSHAVTVRTLGLVTYGACSISSPIAMNSFQRLASLQILSVNYHCISDEFLGALCLSHQLKRLVILIDESFNAVTHPGTTEEAWEELKLNCPNIGLRMNVTQCRGGVDNLTLTIFKANMPLTHLKILLCDVISYEVLNTLYIFKETLISLWWVDAVGCSSDESLIAVRDYIDLFEIHPLIYAAWRCTKLQELIVLGYRYFADDLKAIARLRGRDLRNLEVMRCLMETFDDDIPLFSSVKEIEHEVSRELQRPWKATRRNMVHPYLLNPNMYNAKSYTLPILCNDIKD